MNHRPPSDNTPDPERYLKDTADSFSFDLDGGIYKPKAYQHETKSSAETNTGPPSWQFWITTVLSTLTLLAVAVYAYYAALQWCETKKAADAATVAAIAAKTQAELTSKQMERTSAAIVFNRIPPSISQSGTTRALRFSLDNKGFVIAKDVHLIFALYIHDMNTSKSNRIFADEKIIPRMIPSGEPARQDIPRPDAIYNFTISDSTSKQIEAKSKYLVVDGQLRYDDGFNVNQQQLFCYTFIYGVAWGSPCDEARSILSALREEKQQKQQ